MGTEHNHKVIDCYYYVRGYCHCREEGSMYCTQKGEVCVHFKRDLMQEQWKEKYWSLMRMLREKVSK